MPGYSNLSSFEDLVTKFEFQGTVHLHLHGTVCVIIKFLRPNSLIIAYFLSLYEKIVARAAYKWFTFSESWENKLKN